MSEARKEEAEIVTRLFNRAIRRFSVRVAMVVGMLAAVFALSGCVYTAPLGAAGPLPPAQPIETFVDSRDNRSYKTVRIGSLIWFAENLHIKTDKSWCLNDDNSNCEKFGRLYSWESALNACPAGWRLPDTVNWNELIRISGGSVKGGENLKSRTDWGDEYRATDYFGFNALPGGHRYGNVAVGIVDRSFGSLVPDLRMGGWWSATERTKNVKHAYRIGLATTDHIISHGPEPKNYGYSIRCVSDAVHNTAAAHDKKEISHVPPAETAHDDEETSHGSPAETVHDDEEISHGSSTETVHGDEEISHVPPAVTARNDERISHVPPAAAVRDDERISHVPPAESVAGHTGAASANIHPITVGMRFGGGSFLGLELSCQSAMGEKNRLELGLSWDWDSYLLYRYDYFGLVGIYQWHFGIGDVKGLNWYAGPGAAAMLGTYTIKFNNASLSQTNFYLNVGGQIGIEYDLKSANNAPFLLSLDFRPMFGLLHGAGFGWGTGLGIRYTF